MRFFAWVAVVLSVFLGILALVIPAVLFLAIFIVIVKSAFAVF